jgi:hypothetical protein
MTCLTMTCGAGIVTMTSAFEFCVADKGELLSTESLKLGDRIQRGLGAGR